MVALNDKGRSKLTQVQILQTFDPKLNLNTGKLSKMKNKIKYKQKTTEDVNAFVSELEGKTKAEKIDLVIYFFSGLNLM